jgi:hypothetical protein
MKSLVAALSAYPLYWLGLLAHFIMERIPDDGKEPTPVFDFFFRVYQFFMVASCDIEQKLGTTVVWKPVSS